MIVQLVGQVTGLRREVAIEMFAKAETHLEQQGYEVVNPMKIVPDGEKWPAAMRTCIASLCRVDAIAILPTWIFSRGAKVEYMVATALNLEIIRL